MSDCSLREAIAAANSEDTINVPEGTYTLTLGSELTIDKNLTLTGDGSTNSTIIQAAASSADATHRVFTITAGSNVAISGVIIRHGRSKNFSSNHGGGIRNFGTLTLADSKVINNATSGFNYGGGIYNGGGATLSLTNSTIGDNTATNGAAPFSLKVVL